MTIQGEKITATAREFYRMLHARGPFASVYFENSYNMANPAANLDIRWRDIEHELKKAGAAPDLIAMVHRAVMESDPPAGRSEHCIIATAEGVQVSEHLDQVSVLPLIRVSSAPYLLPLLRDGHYQDRYLLVAVDHLGAELTVHLDGGEVTTTIDPGNRPVHKAHSAEGSEYGESQQRVETMVNRNIREVAERVAAAAAEIDAQAVFVVGDVRSRSDLIAALPESVSRHAILAFAGTRHQLKHSQLRSAISGELARQRYAAIQIDIDRFRAALTHGHAVQGLSAVWSALCTGSVDTLLVGDVADRTVIAGAGCGLSPFKNTPTAMVRADEALPVAALATGASITLTGGQITLTDGVGALLRS
jgi:hypothetical protein